VKSLSNEQQVHGMPESSIKRAMENRIRIVHANMGADVVFDVVADCGGGFYVLEEKDDLRSIVLDEEAGPVDLTDFDAMCYEYAELSEDGMVFELFQVTNDAGGPCFFVRNEPWIGEGFRRELAAACGRCPDVQGEEREADHGNPDRKGSR
jgi:hypothetical protein